MGGEGGGEGETKPRFNDSLKPSPINQLKRQLFVREKIQSNPLHLFYHLGCLFERNITLLNGLNRKVNQKP